MLNDCLHTEREKEIMLGDVSIRPERPKSNKCEMRRVFPALFHGKLSYNVHALLETAASDTDAHLRVDVRHLPRGPASPRRLACKTCPTLFKVNHDPVGILIFMLCFAFIRITFSFFMQESSGWHHRHGAWQHFGALWLATASRWCKRCMI